MKKYLKSMAIYVMMITFVGSMLLGFAYITIVLPHNIVDWNWKNSDHNGLYHAIVGTFQFIVFVSAVWANDPIDY